MGDVTGLVNAGTSAPRLLRSLHHQLEVGAVVHSDPPRGAMAQRAAPTSGDLADLVMVGAGFEPMRSAGGRRRWRRALTLADSVGPNMEILVVGLNPSPSAAAAGVGFAGPTNRFWPAALRAGLVTMDRDPDAALADHGMGMTDLVKRTTARAAELTTAEFRSGLDRLEALVSWLQPGVVCVVGITGWRAATDRAATIGLQPRRVGDRPVYVMANPSGLNAHVTTDDLANSLTEARQFADPA